MTTSTPGRIPLMAGNWKMNLNHAEAVVLVQKLAWILADKKHDFARTEVVVVPPFTDLRSVQTVVDGDRLAIRYGAQDVSAHDPGAQKEFALQCTWGCEPLANAASSPRCPSSNRARSQPVTCATPTP